MKSLLAAALLGLAALVSAPVQAQGAVVGLPVPDVSLPGWVGPASPAASRLSELKGKLVYVDFWASWCAPCKQSFPWMNEMQRKYGARGLQIVAINVDAKRSDADAFLAKGAPAFALAFDSKGESAKTLGVKAMPTSVLVAPDGRVLYVHQGFKPEQQAELEAKLVAALAAK